MPSFIRLLDILELFIMSHYSVHILLRPLIFVLFPCHPLGITVISCCLNPSPVSLHKNCGMLKLFVTDVGDIFRIQILDEIVLSFHRFDSLLNLISPVQ